MNPDQVCGCCDRITVATPALIENRPGLSSIRYRVGTWAQFKATMLDQLSLTPELESLRTRSDDDFSIGLLDAWALVCDILTFYSERIANESYLRTATERLSIGEMAKLIGYKLRPGVAASAWLSFTLDQPVVPPKAPDQPTLPPKTPVPQLTGAPGVVPLGIGTKAQSIPGPGEQPATFETIESIEARTAWNAILPRMSLPVAGVENLTANVRLKGLVSEIQVGDPLLIVADAPYDASNPAVHHVTGIEQDKASQTTLVRFEPNLDPSTTPLPTAPGSIPQLQIGVDDTLVWSAIKQHVWPDQTVLVAQAMKLQLSIDELEDGINALRGMQAPGQQPPLKIFTLKVRASLFGHNAPFYDSIPASLRFDSGVEIVDPTGTPTGNYKKVPAPYPATWEGLTLAGDSVFKENDLTFDLDNVYPALVAGDWLVLESGDGSVQPFAAKIGSTAQLSRTDYLVTSKVSRIALEGSSGQLGPFRYAATHVHGGKLGLTLAHVDGERDQVGKFALRTTHVLGQTDELSVADVAVNNEVGPGPLMLDGAYLWLKVGQHVAVSGERADKAGEIASEVVSIKSLSLVDGYTTVVFDPELNLRYVRKTVVLNANAALSTHGETKSEILGSGDATVPFSRFALRQTPLTYISSTTPSGTASTLTVRVNGVRWKEVDWLYGHGRTESVYTVVVDYAGKTWVQFGDGATGARLPSGRDNVQATYRQGIGQAGMVRAGQLSTLLSRPLGLKDVSNPLPASGAGDSDTLADARENAPITVRTIDRVVSLEDFADFARASAGVAKAAVTWQWDGTRYVACVTVAGPDGAAVVPGTLQFVNLLKAIRDASDGTIPVALCTYVPVTFTLGATIMIDPDYVSATVLDAVKAVLRDSFSFTDRGFTQPVFRSEVIKLMQEVPGVVALTLDAFNYSGGSASTQPDALIASAPILGAKGLIGAQLLTLESGPLPGVVVKT